MFPGNDEYIIARKKMVNLLRDKGICNQKILEAFEYVPRHLFISEALRYRAYELTSLPIGMKQTISNPLTVANMLQSLELDKAKSILEIGTGSGYQTALLSYLYGNVYSQERIKDLHLRSKKILLFDLFLRNINLYLDYKFDHYKILFDEIIVSAGASSLPEELLNLLKIGGTLVLPIGLNDSQKIRRYRRISQNEVTEEVLGNASFVPLLHS